MNGLPVWRYQVAETILETRLLLPYMQNTVHITYRVVSGAGPVRLELHPSMHFRGHEAPVNTPFQGPYTLTIRGEKQEKTEQKGEVLYQGIAARAFERRFQLADHVQVTGAGPSSAHSSRKTCSCVSVMPMDAGSTGPSTVWM